MKIEFIACDIQDNILYGITSTHNIIYVVDEKGNEYIEYIDATVFDDYSYSDIIVNGDEIILIPSSSDWVIVHSLKLKKTEYIKIRDDICGIRYKFLKALYYENCVYMIGHFYSGIAILDLCTNTITYIDIPYRKIVENDAYLGTSYCIEKEFLFIPSLQANEIVRIDLKRRDVTRITVGNGRYIGIEKIDNNFWLIPREDDKCIVFDGNKCNEIELNNPKLYDDYLLSYVFEMNNRIIIGGYKNYSIEIDKNNLNRRITTTDNYTYYKKINENSILYIKNGEIILRNPNQDKLYGKVERDIKIPELSIANKRILMRYEEVRKSVIVESQDISLREWLKVEVIE